MFDFKPLNPNRVHQRLIKPILKHDAHRKSSYSRPFALPQEASVQSIQYTCSGPWPKSTREKADDEPSPAGFISQFH